VTDGPGADAEGGADRRRSPVVRLLLLGLGAVLVGTGAYLLSIRTGGGQRLDDLAFEGRKATDLSFRRAVAACLRATPVVVLLAALALLVTARRRDRWRAGLVAVAGIVASLVVARGLKLVLTRPALVELAYAGPDNTFPSGHVAVTVATVLAWLSLVAPARRDAASVLGAVVIAAYAVAMLVTGWHRASDVVGGAAVAVAVLTTCTAAAWRPGEGSVDESRPVAPTTLGPRARAAVVAGAALATSSTVLAMAGPRGYPGHPLWAQLLAVAVCSALGAAAALAFASALGGGPEPRVRTPGT